jgi:hypothetical protein
VAWASIGAGGHELLTFGVRVDGDDVQADKLHNQLFTLPETPDHARVGDQPGSAGQRRACGRLV